MALQVSPQQPAIFHAITATGTMARVLTVLIHPSFTRPILQEPAKEALRQYQMAIKVLQTYVDRSMAGPIDTGPILLVCLLCVCFEAFRGKKSAAMEHARLGWNIVKGYPPGSRLERDSSVRFFESVFGKHGGASCLFDDKEHHDLVCCIEPLHLANRPFVSMEEAKSCLTKLMKLGEHFRAHRLELSRASLRHNAQAKAKPFRDGENFCLPSCLSRIIAIPESQIPRFEQLRRAHMQWRDMYAASQEIFEQTNSEDPLILLIKHFNSSFALATCRDNSELLTDEYANDFKATLDLTERYLAVVDRGPVRAQKSPVVERPRQDIFFGSSILPSLHLIAHKCRDPQSRRRAVHLMSTAGKQEGLDYSQILAYYAQGAIDIEELRAKLQTHGDTPFEEYATLPLQSKLPEQARFADIVTVGQGMHGVLSLICVRFLHEEFQPPKQIDLAWYDCDTVSTRLTSCWRFDI